MRWFIQEGKQTSDTVFCPGCGITLRPFMKRCPRCGTERADASEPTPPAPELLRETSDDSASLPSAAPLETAPVSKPNKTAVIPIDETKRRTLLPEDPAANAPYDAIFLSPPDEVRRFPLFTRAQIVLLLVGLGLLLLGLLIGYLLWSREVKDTAAKLNDLPPASPPPPAVVPSSTGLTLELNASPTPSVTVDDQVLQEEARKALIAYNPTGFARYKFTVKGGVITLTGEAEHQPEKDGATNVLRLLAGVKTVVNNLVIKSEGQAAATSPPTPGSAQASLSSPPVPPPEAKPSEATAAPDNSQAALEAQREAERLKRELEAARQREAELQRQRELEAQHQREAEEARQRQQQEEARRLEVERQTRPAPTPNRTEPSSLRSGTVAWSGVVDGVDEVVISGGSASVRHVSGEAVREVRASFSAPMPRAAVSVKLLANSGRGTIRIVQEPDAANGYTTIVRIDDSANGGARPHQFTLRWTLQ